MNTPDQRPSVSSLTDPDWRAALAVRWQALGLEILGVGSTPRRTLPELGRECQALAIVAAWFEARGNLTHAAAFVGTTRRLFRERIVAWRHRNPHFVPNLPERQRAPSKPRRRKAKPEDHEPAVGKGKAKVAGQGSGA
jgi:hypothetical protein